MSDDPGPDGENPEGTRVTLSITFDQRTGRFLSAGVAEGGERVADTDPVLMAVRNATVAAIHGLPRKLAEELRPLIDTGDTTAALDALRNGVNQGMLGVAPVARDVVELVARIDAGSLPEEDRLWLFRIRAEVGALAGRYDLVERDARAFVEEYRGGDATLVTTMRLIRANAAAQLGKRELAEQLYLELLKQGDLEPIDRAWVQRGLSMVLGPYDERGADFAEKSSDSFLQAGDRREAVKSLLGLAQAYEVRDPDKALAILERAGEPLKSVESFDVDLKAFVTRAKAALFLRFAKAREALPFALDALELQRAIGVPPEERIYTLELARTAAAACGDDAQVSHLDDELSKLRAIPLDPTYALRKRCDSVPGLSKDELDDLRRSIEETEDGDLLFAFLTLAAHSNPSLSLADQLEYLDKAGALISEDLEGADEPRYLLAVTYASKYLSAGQMEKALAWYTNVSGHLKARNSGRPAPAT